MHKEGVTKVEFVKKMHERIKNQIQQQTEKYMKHSNKGKREMIFEEGDWVWLHLRKDRFPNQRKSKLIPQGDGHFQVLKRINNNTYQIDMPEEYGVHTTFNVRDLTPFAGSEDEEAEACDLRTNPLREGGDDGRSPSVGEVYLGFNFLWSSWINEIGIQESIDILIPFMNGNSKQILTSNYTRRKSLNSNQI